MSLIDLLREPWPWYVAGPVVGLLVPLLLWLGNFQFGISGNLRHICAAILPGKVEFFRYDWKGKGFWNLAFAAGIVAGGFVGGRLLGGNDVALSEAARQQLTAVGLSDFSGLLPRELFSWSHFWSARTLVSVIAGGVLVGFGTAWAGGCTSGHAISGLANLEKASLVAVIGFFAGGLVGTYFVLPLIL